jgi:hypothetical protein
MLQYLSHGEAADHRKPGGIARSGAGNDGADPTSRFRLYRKIMFIQRQCRSKGRVRARALRARRPVRPRSQGQEPSRKYRRDRMRFSRFLLNRSGSDGVSRWCLVRAGTGCRCPGDNRRAPVGWPSGRALSPFESSGRRAFGANQPRRGMGSLNGPSYLIETVSL